LVFFICFKYNSCVKFWQLRSVGRCRITLKCSICCVHTGNWSSPTVRSQHWTSESSRVCWICSGWKQYTRDTFCRYGTPALFVVL
jgi:hypothetical protein